MIVSKYQNIVFCCCCCCFELNRLRALTDEQPWAQEGYLGHMGPLQVRGGAPIAGYIRIAKWFDWVWYAPTMGGSSTTGKSGGGKLADGWIGTTQGTKAVASKRAGIIWKRTIGDLYCT